MKHADGFATLEIESAIRLRDLGITQPILMLEGFFEDSELALFDRHQLTTAIHSTHQIGAIMQAKLSRPIDTFIKFNTGMNRLGFTDGGGRHALGMAAGGKNFGDITLMTHFASSDTKDGVAEPLKRFRAMGKNCARINERQTLRSQYRELGCALAPPRKHTAIGCGPASRFMGPARRPTWTPRCLDCNR